MKKQKILWRLNNLFTFFFILYPFLIFYISGIHGDTLPSFFPMQDKVFHFFEYGIWGLLGFFALRNNRYFRMKIVIIIVLYAFLDEIHQIFIPGRSCDIYDVIVDVLPLFFLFLVKNPVPAVSVSIKGFYKTKIYDMLRSIIPDKKFSMDGRGELVVWIKEDKIFYFLDRRLIFTRKLRENSDLYVKKTVYEDFCFLLDRNISKWGFLFQVRPIKVLDYVEPNEMDYVLKKVYKVSKEKRVLAINIKKLENEVLKKIGDGIGVYVGIPFCPTKCTYCSFPSYQKEKFKHYYSDYLDALQYEIEQKLKSTGKNVNMLYLGGGTPFVLNEKELEMLFEKIFSYVDKNNLLEFTVEGGRAELFTDKKLEVLKKYGVNRIAINPQTLVNRTLKLINRNHSEFDFLKAYEMTKKYNFDIINSDIIIGLPGESIKENRYTIDKLLSLEDINNITVHILSPKKGATLDKEYFKTAKVHEVAYNYIKKVVTRKQFVPYYLYKQRHILNNLENIGYAKEGKFSYYNIAMISEKVPIIGMGVGASSKYDIEGKLKTTKNPKDLAAYLKIWRKNEN